jgi:hypothetical protein
VITTVEYDLNVSLMTLISTSEMPTFVLHAQHTHIHWQDQQQVTEILLSLINHYFIYVTASAQLYLTFYDALHWFVFGVRAIYGGIGLQASDEIIAVIFSFGQHGYVAGMEKIKG